ncbi:lipase family protein [Mycobacterium sp. NPDC051804]|uniref:lipase family protein n=1 Tax=Mycobacterium sp. NPDC051804 TaxID=3364295 RepID=UPI0037A635A0
MTQVAATRYNVVFRSVSGIDGTLRDVSGSVFVPPGPPPTGGWPLIAYGHGTTGLSPDCGPSAFPDLLGYDSVVASLVALGFVVSVPDFEGLGQPGVHPFLEPRTAAFNMIDAVRAARNVVPDTSTRWFAVGVSQGGQASWAANELAGEYGDGLQFLGSTSQSPFADLSNMPELASGGWLTRAQQVLLPLLVEGLKRTHPGIDPTDYLHGALEANKQLFLACTGPAIEESRAVVVGVADSVPTSPAATDSLRKALADYAVPQRPASGPMLVITGSEDDVVRPQWVTSAVEEACKLGDTVEFVIRDGETQYNLDAGPRVAAWLQERLVGAAPVNTCAT